MEYGIFFTGLCSTPTSVMLKRIDTDEVICRIGVDKPRSRDARARYDKMVGILKKKYKSIL